MSFLVKMAPPDRRNFYVSLDMSTTISATALAGVAEV